MKILGLMMVRNGEEKLQSTLDTMALFCDEIYVLNDRSVDRTLEILEAHPTVTNVFSANAALSQEDWFFTESMNFNFLYRMADFYLPDWVVLVDHDELIEPADEIRSILSSLGKEVSGVRVSRFSIWEDPDYPLMVPLMSSAKSLQGNIWRYSSNLVPGNKPLHNRRFPSDIDNFGKIVTIEEITFHHYGWDTLQKRIRKVDQYMALDPDCRYNFGVPYDRGLLFGYGRDAIDELIKDYQMKFEEYMKRDGHKKYLPLTKT